MKTLKYEEVHRQEYRDVVEARASIYCVNNITIWARPTTLQMPPLQLPGSTPALTMEAGGDAHEWTPKLLFTQVGSAGEVWPWRLRSRGCAFERHSGTPEAQ